MKTKTELIKWCESKLGTPYVYGAKGKKLTRAQIDEWARLYPGTFTPTYIAKAKKYIGRECTDCSGLISWLTGILRGSANYKDTAVQTVAISKLDESMVGWAVWKSGHIGVYVGNGYCIEAKGIDYGTVKTRVSATAWTHVLKLKDIDYTEQIKTGWADEDGGRRYYNGDTGLCVRNDWMQDGDNWYWFNGAGIMVCNVWYMHNGAWYYLGPNGAMLKGLQGIGGKWYCLDTDGQLVMEPVTLTPDKDGALQYPGIG